MSVSQSSSVGSRIAKRRAKLMRMLPQLGVDIGEARDALLGGDDLRAFDAIKAVASDFAELVRDIEAIEVLRGDG